jgi:hypothetical protein
VTLAADGGFVYTPTADLNGIDSFTYILSNGDLTSTASVAVVVSPTDDPPQAVNDGYVSGVEL